MVGIESGCGNNAFDCLSFRFAPRGLFAPDRSRGILNSMGTRMNVVSISVYGNRITVTCASPTDAANLELLLRNELLTSQASEEPNTESETDPDSEPELPPEEPNQESAIDPDSEPAPPEEPEDPTQIE